MNSTYNRRQVLLGSLLALSIAIACGCPASAQDGMSGNDSTTAPAAQDKPSASPNTPAASSTSAGSSAVQTEAASPSTAAGKTYEGGVKGTAVPFEEGMNKIGLAAIMIQQSTAAIMQEATRKDTVVMRGPNVLPNGTVIPALGGSNGVMQFGELPMRRKKLERWLEETEQNLGACQTYVDGLIIPPGKQQAAQQAYTDLRNAMQNAQEHLASLKELSSQKRLANMKIGRQALFIHDAMAEVQKQHDKLEQIIQQPVK